jgi:hypothetical protein
MTTAGYSGTPLASRIAALRPKLALAGDLVDVKVAAIDETWSGLKLVIRREAR